MRTLNRQLPYGLRKLMCVSGTFSRMLSGRGEQLVAASKQLETWDFNGILEWSERKE
jgi:hypothetical protein